MIESTQHRHEQDQLQRTREGKNGRERAIEELKTLIDKRRRESLLDWQTLRISTFLIVLSYFAVFSLYALFLNAIPAPKVLSLLKAINAREVSAPLAGALVGALVLTGTAVLLPRFRRLPWAPLMIFAACLFSVAPTLIAWLDARLDYFLLDRGCNSGALYRQA